VAFVLTIQYQNSLEDYRETGDAIAAARRPVNSPLQIVVLIVIFGVYYAITRFLWQKAGDVDGQLAWMNMWITSVAFGFTWLAISLPASFRARRFPWLTARQAIALTTFITLIASLVFQHWMHHKLNPNSPKIEILTWQTILPHSIWLTILAYVSTIAAHNHRTSLPRHWDARPDLHRHQTVDITADGPTFSDTLSRHEFQWRAFVKSEETKTLFLLFTHNKNAVMVPKRSFDSPEQLDAMRNLLKLIPRDEVPAFPIALVTDPSVTHAAA
jgi:hypothetical protein